jgi:hypothetical protein
MSIWKTIANIGTAAVATVFPAAAPLIPLVNKLLPDDKQLPETATGTELAQAYESLPPEQRVEIDRIAASITIAQEEGWTERYAAMCQADGQSTRPKIALMMAQVLCFEILAFTVWCFVCQDQMNNPILWTVFASLTAVPGGLLGKYFGELRREQGQRLGVNAGGLLAGVARMFK